MNIFTSHNVNKINTINVIVFIFHTHVNMSPFSLRCSCFTKLQSRVTSSFLGGGLHRHVSSKSNWSSLGGLYLFIHFSWYSRGSTVGFLFFNFHLLSTKYMRYLMVMWCTRFMCFVMFFWRCFEVLSHYELAPKQGVLTCGMHGF